MRQARRRPSQDGFLAKLCDLIRIDIDTTRWAVRHADPLLGDFLCIPSELILEAIQSLRRSPLFGGRTPEES